MTEIRQETGETGLEIAVIGMEGRFPGADNIEEFWENLKIGIESIAFFSEKELEEAGIAPGLVQNPNYVKALPRVEDIEYFDAAFFDYTPKEAEIMDPQMRIFHECAYHALEDAGYDPYSYDKLIGCYAGASVNFYWQWKSFLREELDMAGTFEARQLFDKEYLCTRVAHKLNLKGPAINIQTACSTSLVAIHMACQGLLSGECDLALAGGVSLPYMKKEGYLYRKGGMILSSDGHCKVFEARSDGTVFGNGIGVVLLKRLQEAVADKDNIHAVVKGSFINNDGLNRGGFTAPSPAGEADVIQNALYVADVSPESIGYVETHSTGTPLGGPIELEGLKLAFNTDKKNFCALSCVKTNVGHLNIASGVTGFIKAVLSLEHRLIPPTLHFQTPDPAADFENSPFYINTALSPWKNNTYPLRAGVNSFGIGGTNAHVVLEEWPGDSGSVRKVPEGTGGLAPLPDRQYQLILLSAKTETALEKMTANLAQYLEKNPDIDLQDVAYTLMVGRRTLKHRRVLVCPDTAEARRKLSLPTPGKVHTFFNEVEKRPVIFMFPGLGSQYVNMGKDLYQTVPVFRQEMDRCFEILKPLMEYDIKETLYPFYRSNRTHTSYKSHSSYIHQTEIAQVVIFAFEYALAKLTMNWGITPHAMIGYSFGEYTAACISGVLSLEDALKMIVTRGKLLEKISPGALLSVPLTRKELTPLLSPHPELSLAIDNGPSCIAAGPLEAIDAFEKEMKQNRYICMRIPSARALHSTMMEPILKEFEDKIAREITLNEPQIPYISNVSGGWLTSEDIANPAYWATHLRETVQFSDGINQLMKEEKAIFLEIGPGRDLSTLLVRHIEDKPGLKATHLVRHQEQKVSDIYVLLNRIGRLWLWGVDIDWNQFYAGEKPRRVSLPKYPFERKSFHIEEDLIKQAANMFSQPSLTDKQKLSRADAAAAGVNDNTREVIRTAAISRRPDIETEYVSPRDEIEQKIARIWAQSFGFERIGIDDDFIELGGDSLKALIVITTIHKELGVELAMNEFFKSPTIRNMAPLIADKAQEKQQLFNNLFGGLPRPEEKGPDARVEPADMKVIFEKHIDRPLVILNQPNQKKLFCFPPAMGYGIAYKVLSTVMTEYSFYSFNFIEPGDRFEKYVEIITTGQPVGPYILFGFSAAGKLTMETAKALEDHGCEVSDIILIDTFWAGGITNEEIAGTVLESIEKSLEDEGVGFLKDKILTKIKSYQEYFNDKTHLETVNANIHLIVSEENRGKPICKCWHPFTAKTSRIYQGYGEHGDMLYPAGVEKNAKIIRDILKHIEAKTPGVSKQNQEKGEDP